MTDQSKTAEATFISVLAAETNDMNNFVEQKRLEVAEYVEAIDSEVPKNPENNLDSEDVITSKFLNYLPGIMESEEVSNFEMPSILEGATMFEEGIDLKTPPHLKELLDFEKANDCEISTLSNESEESELANLFKKPDIEATTESETNSKMPTISDGANDSDSANLEEVMDCEEAINFETTAISEEAKDSDSANVIEMPKNLGELMDCEEASNAENTAIPEGVKSSNSSNVIKMPENLEEAMEVSTDSQIPKNIEEREVTQSVSKPLSSRKISIIKRQEDLERFKTKLRREFCNKHSRVYRPAPPVEIEDTNRVYTTMPKIKHSFATVYFQEKVISDFVQRIPTVVEDGKKYLDLPEEFFDHWMEGMKDDYRP